MHYSTLLLLLPGVSAAYYQKYSWDGQSIGPNGGGRPVYYSRGTAPDYKSDATLPMQAYTPGKSIFTGDINVYVIYYQKTTCPSKGGPYFTTSRTSHIEHFLTHIHTHSWWRLAQKYVYKATPQGNSYPVGQLAFKKSTTVLCDSGTGGAIGCDLCMMQLEKVVDYQLQNNVFPRDSNGVYLIIAGPELVQAYVEGQVGGAFDDNHPNQKRLGVHYCSYHGAFFSNNKRYSYGFIQIPNSAPMDVTSIRASWGTKPTSNCFFRSSTNDYPNGVDLAEVDAGIHLLAHEVVEMITNPDPEYYASYTDTFYNEVMDKCEYAVEQVASENNAKLYNVEVNRRKFLLPSIFDPTTQKCSLTTAPPQTWSHLGCYKDGQNSVRLLNGLYITSQLMTNQECQSLCSSKGFMYAGTEVGGECFCGNSLDGSNNVLTNAAECNSNCYGDATQKCGGPWRISLYSIASSAVNWRSLGCYKDSSSRALRGYYQILSSNSPAACQAECAKRGFRYAGLENKNECFCGNQIEAQDQNTLAASTDCNMPCPGSTKTMCGGASRINLYTLNTWSFAGCYIDGNGGRVLPDFYSPGQSGLTTQQCQDVCASRGYNFAGTEVGTECHCANNINIATGNIPTNITECSWNCGGNANEKCGGAWRINLYRKNIL